MEKYEGLEEVLESRKTFSKKVEEAFGSLPEENWLPLKSSANYFPVKIAGKKDREIKVAILYEVRNSIEQNNLFGRLFKDENEVYLSSGKVYENGKSVTYMFFSRRVGDSYRNVAFADYRAKKAVFDSKELEGMNPKQLRRFAYAINQYLSGNYDKL